jgi:hypothetical protein
MIYRIKRSPRAKPKVVHHDRLKLYIGEDIFLNIGFKMSWFINKQTNIQNKLKLLKILEWLRLHFQNIYLHVLLHVCLN